MRRERIDWGRYVPAGLDGRRERGRVLSWIAMGNFWSLWFLLFYRLELDRICGLEAAHMPPREGRMAVPFEELLAGSGTLFVVALTLLLELALRYYLRHYRSGRSIYLMRRLPDRWELCRRCLTLPLAGVVVLLLLRGMLMAGCFLLYRACIPAGWLPEGGASARCLLRGLFTI